MAHDGAARPACWAFCGCYNFKTQQTEWGLRMGLVVGTTNHGVGRTSARTSAALSLCANSNLGVNLGQLS